MTPMRSWLVRADVIGTVVFAITIAIGAPLRDERAAQTLVVIVSIALFAVGIFTSLSAYVTALDRSRVHEIGVGAVGPLPAAVVQPAGEQGLLGAVGVVHHRVGLDRGRAGGVRRLGQLALRAGKGGRVGRGEG